MFDSGIFFRIRSYITNDDGVATEWSIMWTVIFLILGGFSIDTGYALRTHQLLQASADAASSAGAIQLWQGGAVDEAAIQYARYNMPRGLNGNVLVSSDVFVGTWDHVNKVFTETSVNPDAVKVQTRRTSANGNALPTIFLGLIGFKTFDIASESVTHLLMSPACLDSGIIANGRVNVGSNNTVDGFCIHGFRGIDVKSGNSFGSYTAPDGMNYPILTVGSPYDPSGAAQPVDQWITGSSYATLIARNPGLLGNIGTRPGFKSRAAERVASYITSLYDPANPPPNFTALSQKTFSALDQSTLSGSYYVTCNGGKKIKLDPKSNLISNLTLVTNCQVEVEDGVTLANVTIATTMTGRKAVDLEDDVTLGADVCDELSGTLNSEPQQSTILALGDVKADKGFKSYGSKIISAANIRFAAKTDGLNGVSIQADGDVSMASRTDYRAGPCKVPLNDDFVAPYWRIVR